MDYSDCHSCRPGWFDINADKPELEFAYCLPGCPTGFKLDANNHCTRSEEEEEEVVACWDFNVPINTYNQQECGYTDDDIIVDLINSDVSGVPAKNRGVCFDGTSEGYLEIQPLLL